MQVPGIGPLTATALVAAVGNGAAFAKGRDLAAWLGLVPRQHSTGGKTVLRGISKRGNAYLRSLFIHGARAVCRHHRQKPHRLGWWLANLEARAHPMLSQSRSRINWYGRRGSFSSETVTTTGDSSRMRDVLSPRAITP